MMMLVLRGQASSLLNISGIPVVESWQGMAFVAVAIFLWLTRRRGESLISMDELDHKLELATKARDRIEQSSLHSEQRAQIAELQQALQQSSRDQLQKTESERDERLKKTEAERDAYHQKLHESRNDNLRLLERALIAETALASVMGDGPTATLLRSLRNEQRLRDGRDTYAKIAHCAVGEMEGLEERSEELGQAISQADEAVSVPSGYAYYEPEDR